MRGSRIGQYRISENLKQAGTRRPLARERSTSVCIGINGEKVHINNKCHRAVGKISRQPEIAPAVRRLPSADGRVA
jgi:hypothetical protein